MADDAYFQIGFELDNKSTKEVEEKLTKAIEDAVKKGSADFVKQFADGSKKIATFMSGKKYYSAIFNQDKDNKITGLKVSRVNKQIAKKLSESQTEGEYETTLSKYKMQKAKADRNRDVKLRAKKVDDDRQKKIELAKAWASAIGEQLPFGGDLEQKKIDLADTKEKFMKLGKTGGKEFDELTKKAAKLSAEIKKMEDSLKPTAFQRLVNTIKRVGFYRIARNLFRLVENGFKQGISGLIQFDSQANSTMSSISSEFKKINASFAMILLPVFQALQPFITSMSNAIADFADKISLASAKMNGLSEYTKVNRKYMEDLAAAANSASLSFDKFETINGQDSPFETALVKDEDVENAESAVKVLKNMQEIVSRLAKTLSDIWEKLKPNIGVIGDFILDMVDIGLQAIITLSPYIKDIAMFIIQIAEWLGKAIKTVLDAGPDIVKLLVVIGLLIGVAFGNVKALIALIMFAVAWIIKNSEKIGRVCENIGIFIGNLFKIVANFIIEIINFVIRCVVGLVNGIIDVINALLGPIDWIVRLFGGSGGLRLDYIEAGQINKFEYTQYKEHGGLVDKGDLFIANERGPELVYGTDSGKTNVTNTTQFKQAMLEALYEWGGGFGSSGGGDVVLNLDGAEVARSKRFRAEVNRRNSGINLL